MEHTYFRKRGETRRERLLSLGSLKLSDDGDDGNGDGDADGQQQCSVPRR